MSLDSWKSAENYYLNKRTKLAARRYLDFDEGETGNDIAKQSTATVKTRVKRQKIDQKNAQKLNHDQLYEKMVLEPLKTPAKDLSYSDIFNKSDLRLESLTSTQQKRLMSNTSSDFFNNSNISRKSSEERNSPTKWKIEKKLLIASYEDKNLAQQKIFILLAEKLGHNKK